MFAFSSLLDCFKPTTNSSDSSKGSPRRQRRLSDPVDPEILADFGRVIDQGSEEELSKFLTLHYDIDPRLVFFSDGKSPLTRAVATRNVGSVRLLIRQHHVDINASDRTDYQMTALHTAIKLMDRDMAAVLIQEGANPNVRTGVGLCTPLHWSASRDFVDGARLLLDSGADFKAQDRKGLTPLDWSLYHNEVEVAAFLRAHIKEHGQERQEETKEAGAAVMTV